jgi:hypothetical protein
MTISFQCEHCRREVTAPDEAAGKRGKCPYCGHSNYIPAPVSEEEILDLAPVDEEEERRRQEEVRRIREQEKALLAEIADKAPVPLEQRTDLTSADLHHFVVNYCLDLYTSKIQRLRQHVDQLLKFKPLALQAVEDFLSGRVSEPALKGVPPRAMKGFLMQLRDELRK